ncbi:DnaD domain protein [Psychrobacillus sp. NEAU-3TGS]|uniref:DnaD domain protein n=1 Tax=Psychrobacillus sp. NEAU-3TGS TaxID=2995412 RepID=UPI0024987188|nr:DnaD domain protein [Psychrobacillus sp. NEAU-3TGS]MDI2588081.1 DnaD domain protein [Psychrobacillus sp. NEAU-3TGS]
MAKYRQVHTTFWDDGFVLDLTPEEKYFYLYLMTNGNTTQCGIYELPYRVIEMHTGYNRETVLKLLQRFVEYGKITYNESTKEIMINNWARYNFINSPKVKKCIEKELIAVKHIPFVHAYLTSLKQYGYSIDTVSIPHISESETKGIQPSDSNGSIPYQYPMDSPCIDLGEEEEQEEEQEKEREEEQEEQQEEQQEKVGQSVRPSSGFAKLVDFTNNNIQPVAQAVGEKLGYMLDDYKDAELIIEALKEAILKPDVKNKYTYAEGILRNWKNEMITNLEQLNTKCTREATQHGSNGKSNGSTTGKNLDEFYKQLERDKQAWGD